MRTAEDIRAQQLLYNQSSLTSAVSGLPPSYIEGFKHTVDRFYRVTIGAGVTTVQGTRVEITADTFLRDADWLCVKTTDSGSFYYVYLTRTGLLKVDRTAPTYSGTYFYYQHPTFGYRSIGKLWASSAGNILWASSNFTAYSNQLTTAQTGYLGYADYYVDTDEDASIKFQMANDYLYGAFNGGANTIQRGTYTIENTVTLNYGVTFKGEGEQTLINVNTVGTNGFEFGGSVSFGCGIESCKIVNIETTAQDKYLIDFNGSPKGKVYNSILDYTKCAGIFNDGSNNSIVNNTLGGGKSNVISYGDEATFNNAATKYVAVAALTSTTFVVAYQDDADTDKGKVAIGVVTNNTTITFGAEYIFNNAVTTYIYVARLTDTSFVVTYTDDGNSLKGTSIIGVVSNGNEVTFGSEYVLNNAETYYCAVTALTSTKIAVSFMDVGDANKGKVIIGDVANDDEITYGSEHVFNAASTTYNSIARLTDTTFVVAYQDDGATGDPGTAVIGSVSGTTVTYGSEYVFNTAATVYLWVSRLTDTKFVISYRNVSVADYGSSIIGVVTSTNVITYGNSQIFNREGTLRVVNARLSDETFAVAYADTGNAYYGTAIFGYLKDNVVIPSAEYVFNAAAVTYCDIDFLTGGYCVVAYYGATTGKARIISYEIANVTAIESSGNNAIIQSNHIIADDTYVQEVGIYVSGDENIVANNQIDGHDDPYDRNIKVGVLVTSDSVRSQVVSNSVKNNLNYGFVNYGTNTSFAQNLAFNNGSDRYELIDRGDCQSATAPMLFGETVPVTSDATITTSTDFGYDSRAKSFKFVKTVAAGTYCYTMFVSSTSILNGMIPGLTYIGKVQIYIPTASGIAGTEITVRMFDNVSGATTVACANTYDSWQEVTITKTLSTTATQAWFYLYTDTTAALNEYFYVGDVSLTCSEQGIRNIYQNNFLDAGTGTQLS